MVSNFQSAATLYHEPMELDGTTLSDTGSHSIISEQRKNNMSLQMDDYYALHIQEIGVAFLATRRENQTFTCYVWTRFVQSNY